MNSANVRSTSRVIFMCGPAGSGKSTYAKALAVGGMVRLSFDEESFALGITSHPLPQAIHDQIEVTLLQRLTTLIAQNEDVVLDFSFWSRAMRARYRHFLAPYGIVPEIVYIRTPKVIALQRIQARTGRNDTAIQLSMQTAISYYDHFEPPTVDEGPLTLVPGY